MTSDEFRLLIKKKSSSALLGPCLRDDVTPYVFEPKPASWNHFRDMLVSRLGVVRRDITVVGSGRFGFSMKPNKNLSRFHDGSDIDIVVVNADLFDELWMALLDAAYPRPPLDMKLGGWLNERRKEVYTGWLTPLDIKLDAEIVGTKAKPVLNFNTRWFNTFKEASQYPPRRHEDIKTRLYRTWKHAELYHLNSLAALRKSLEM